MSSGREATHRPQEEYLIWKKNTPYLYDLLLSHALEWPSLTAQWLSNSTESSGSGQQGQRLILGTHTGGADPNSLLIAEVNFPTEVDTLTPTSTSRISIVQQITHEGEIHRARHMPQNRNIIATKSVSPAVFLYDLAQHNNSSDQIHSSRGPNATLLGHKRGGYGLGWNNCQDRVLASGSDDTLVCVWDVSKEATPTTTLRGHHGIVEDVSWSFHHDWFLASVADDKKMALWDTRSSGDAPTTLLDIGGRELNCVSFNPGSENLIVTGGADGSVLLWDHRKLSSRLHTFKAHGDEVYGLHFAPFNPTILASCGADCRLHVNDLSLIGSEPPTTTTTAQNATPPELLFVHAGHLGKISDFGWNQNAGFEWVVVSVSEDNILQVWKMSSYMYTPLSALTASQDGEA